MNGSIRIFAIGVAAGLSVLLACDQETAGPPAPSIALTPGTATLEVGQTTALVASITGLSSSLVSFSSSNSAVASVHVATGVVTAVAPGTATITAVAFDDRNLVASSQVTVVAAPPLTLAADPPAATLEIGGTQQLTVSIRNAAGPVTGRTVGWTSGATGVATVSETGLVTGVGAGEAVVTGTVSGPGGGTVTVPVTVLGPVSVAVTPSPVNVQVGAKVTLEVALTRGGAPVTRPLTFTSADGSLATVSEAGVVTGVSVGATTITVAASGAGASSVAVPVTVSAPTLLVSVMPETALLNIGQFLTLNCSVRNANTGEEVTAAVRTWSSGNTAVATVSATGSVMAVGQGSTTITCQPPGGPSASAVVTVVQPPLTLSVGADSLMVGAGESVNIALTMRDHLGVLVTDRTVTFASGNPAVATIAPGGAPLTFAINGVSAGTTTIDFASLGAGASTLSVPITVTAPPGCVLPGSYPVGTTVVSDPGGHNPFIQMADSLNLNVTRPSASSIGVTGPFPFVAVSGSITPDCTFSITGVGTVAGFPNTLVRLEGTAVDGVKWTLTYVMGAGGNLPGGQPITYGFTRK